MMTGPGQPGQPSKATDNPPGDTRQLTGRSSRARHKGRWIWLSVIALLGLSAALIYAGAGGTHQAASSGSSAGSGAAAGAPGSTRGTAVSAAGLAAKAGALNLPKDMQRQAVSWHSGPGGTRLAAVSNWLGTALQAGGVRQYSSMRHACTQLAGSVATAKAGPPIPDAAMQDVYAEALSQLASGAAACQSAISLRSDSESVEVHLDTSLLRQSISELSAGATGVFRSTAEIEIISRQHHGPAAGH